MELMFKLTGTRPLLMHAAVGVDPLDPRTIAHKKLTSVRTKTEEIHVDIAKSDFALAMYHDENLGPYIPGECILACLRDGAKLSKRGKDVTRGVSISEDRVKLEYNGPRTVDALWDAGWRDARNVKVGQARLVRYRPRFEEWSGAACTRCCRRESRRR